MIGFPPRVVSGYQAVAATAAITEFRERTVARFTGDELATMRTYLRTNLPTAQALSTVPESDGRLFSVESVTHFFDVVQAILSRVAAIPKLAIDLCVASTPSVAHFRLETAGGESRETTTVSLMSKVYRGLYTYRVEKNGYKNVAGALDLVNGTEEQLSCQLFALDSLEGPYPCRLVRRDGCRQ